MYEMNRWREILAFFTLFLLVDPHAKVLGFRWHPHSGPPRKGAKVLSNNQNNNIKTIKTTFKLAGALSKLTTE